MFYICESGVKVIDDDYISCELKQKGKSTGYLKPIILEEVLMQHKQQLVQMLTKEFDFTLQQARHFDKYTALITKQVGTNTQVTWGERESSLKQTCTPSVGVAVDEL